MHEKGYQDGLKGKEMASTEAEYTTGYLAGIRAQQERLRCAYISNLFERLNRKTARIIELEESI